MDINNVEEEELADWATFKRSPGRLNVTSDGSLDSCVKEWQTEVERGAKREREELEDGLRARRRKLERRARREERQPPVSNTDDE